jgi:exosome complex component RRP40
VCLAERDMEAELTCISPATQQADGFGELKNGYVFTCSLPLARSLINTQHPLLQALGDRLPFEVAVGYNGRVWVNSDTTRHLILVVNALQNLEHHVQLDKNQAVKMVQQLFDNMDIE